jgi:uncharacterized protein (TIGR02996 family)
MSVHDYLQAIKRFPVSNDTRLVLADLVEKGGQRERAELIRIQVECARRQSGDPQQSCDPRQSCDPQQTVLQQREEQLLAEHGQLWLGRWAGLGTFQGGLIDLDCTPRQLQERLTPGAEADLFWVKSLRLQGPWQDIQLVLTDSLLRHLVGLDLSNNDLGPDAASTLAALPQMRSLRTLNLAYNSLECDGTASLAKSLYLRRLKTINLAYNGIVYGARTLATPNLEDLTSLTLSGNSINSVATELLTSPCLSNLAHLDLGSCRSINAAAAVAASANLNRVTYLSLGRNYVNPEVTVRLARAPHLRNLRTLLLYSNTIGVPGAEALARSRSLNRLNCLNLVDTKLRAAQRHALRRRYGVAVYF